MSSKIIITGLILFCSLSPLDSDAQIAGIKVGSFDQFSDIGSPAIPGSVSYSEPLQAYHLTGSGSNIWFGQDSFSFLSKKMSGDFILQTQIRFMGQGHDAHRKAGLMIRSSTAPNSSVITCTVHGDGLTSFQYRTTPGGTMKEIKMTIKAPDVFQLEKKGNTYTMSVARFGEIYQVETLDSIELGKDLIAGLFICSHNDAFSEEAVFNNTRIYNTAPDDLIQYRTYLGSQLEVMDVATGSRQVLASSEGSWQAPNWTPDGKTLIYNASGKLYNFDLATKLPTELNTDFANKNNNDHVLTFDGKQIGISHHAADAAGQSVIYTLPVTGGVPKRITRQ